MPDIHPINPKLIYLSNRDRGSSELAELLDWDRVVVDWLAIQRAPNTQRAYQKDISQFLTHVPPGGDYGFVGWVGLGGVNCLRFPRCQ